MCLHSYFGEIAFANFSKAGPERIGLIHARYKKCKGLTPAGAGPFLCYN